MKKLMFTGFATLSSVILLSCTSGQEMDDLAKAQKCLDEVPQSSPASADACLQYVEKYSSQQANILKCSIYMTSGGLMESKIVDAYKALKDNTQTNKEAAYMVILSLDKPDVDSGYSKAKNADEFCQASGVSGLRYLSGIIVAGTYMRKVAEAVPGGAAIDLSDPNSVNTVVNNLLQQCAPAGSDPDPACFADGEINTLGTAVVNLANSFCGTQGADQAVCSDVRSALEQAGANTADTGQAILCYLSGKTYDPVSQQCQ